MSIFDDGSDTTDSIREELAAMRRALAEPRPSTLDDWMKAGCSLRAQSPRLFNRALETAEVAVAELTERDEDSAH